MDRRLLHDIGVFVVLGFLGAALYSCSNARPTQRVAIDAAPPIAQRLYTPDQAPRRSNKPTFRKPEFVRGIYLTAWSAGSTKKLTKMIDLLARTELNAFVIDVRDSGDMYFPTGIALADKVQGRKRLAVVNPEQLMERLSKAQVWPIARIACFRDNWVPPKYPDRAVQFPNGKPWRDRSGNYWLDPYDKRNWEYIAETVDYALNIGFPEIQLDYVRFPSEGKSATQRFPKRAAYLQENPNAMPEDLIQAFASYIRERVKAKGGLLSADIFGIVSSSKSDEGIGQFLEKVAGPFDVVSPMVYPSHYNKGEYGIKNPDAAPYEILMKSLADYKLRIPKKPLRPWLQDFSLGVRYGPKQVRAQIKAVYKQGYKEWLLWNAGNRYSEAGLLKEGQTETTRPVSARSPTASAKR